MEIILRENNKLVRISLSKEDRLGVDKVCAGVLLEHMINYASMAARRLLEVLIEEHGEGSLDTDKWGYCVKSNMQDILEKEFTQLCNKTKTRLRFKAGTFEDIYISDNEEDAAKGLKSNVVFKKQMKSLYKDSSYKGNVICLNIDVEKQECFTFITSIKGFNNVYTDNLIAFDTFIELTDIYGASFERSFLLERNPKWFHNAKRRLSGVPGLTRKAGIEEDDMGYTHVGKPAIIIKRGECDSVMHFSLLDIIANQYRGLLEDERISKQGWEIDTTEIAGGFMTQIQKLVKWMNENELKEDNNDDIMNKLFKIACRQYSGWAGDPFIIWPQTHNLGDKNTTLMITFDVNEGKVKIDSRLLNVGMFAEGIEYAKSNKTMCSADINMLIFKLRAAGLDDFANEISEDVEADCSDGLIELCSDDGLDIFDVDQFVEDIRRKNNFSWKLAGKVGSIKK